MSEKTNVIDMQEWRKKLRPSIDDVFPIKWRMVFFPNYSEEELIKMVEEENKGKDK